MLFLCPITFIVYKKYIYFFFKYVKADLHVNTFRLCRCQHSSLLFYLNLPILLLFNAAPAYPCISLSVSLPLLLFLSGCTWYSLACLSTRRLDGSNLFEQPCALLGAIYCTKPMKTPLKSSSTLHSLTALLLCRFFSFYISSGHISSPSARMTLTDTHT